LRFYCRYGVLLPLSAPLNSFSRRAMRWQVNSNLPPRRTCRRRSLPPMIILFLSSSPSRLRSIPSMALLALRRAWLTRCWPPPPPQIESPSPRVFPSGSGWNTPPTRRQPSFKVLLCFLHCMRPFFHRHIHCLSFATSQTTDAVVCAADALSFCPPLSTQPISDVNSSPPPLR